MWPAQQLKHVQHSPCGIARASAEEEQTRKRRISNKGAGKRTGSEEAVEKVAEIRTGRNVEKGTTEKRKGVVHRT